MRKILVAAAMLCSVTSSIAFLANAADFSQDIKQIRNTQLVKGELETTAEFNARTKGLYEKYANKKYLIEIDVKTAPSEYKLLTYNPDAEELTVSLPRLEKKLVWVPRGNDRKIGYLNFSFLQTEPISIESDSYVGRNGFGTEVRVERSIANSVGIAILGSSNRNMLPQQFKTKIIREKIRDLFEKGMLVLEVRADLQNLEKEPSLLIVDKDEVEPSMKRPIHAKHTKHMLPVRLIAITLLDGNKNIVLKAVGTEQHTVSIEI